jgi:hypothetical protein
VRKPQSRAAKVVESLFYGFAVYDGRKASAASILQERPTLDGTIVQSHNKLKSLVGARGLETLDPPIKKQPFL